MTTPRHDPGPAWTETDRVSVALLIQYDDTPNQDVVAMWVPVRPMPTEPGYYLDALGEAWRLYDDGQWWCWGNRNSFASVIEPNPVGLRRLVPEGDA